MKQICKRYVALDPDGVVCGPCTPDEDMCWKALRIGYERTFYTPASDEKIRGLGYAVVLATVSWGWDDKKDSSNESPHPTEDSRIKNGSYDF